MPARPAADRAPLDVSGRPLALRDVDLDAFLHPKTIAVIGASQRPARPNTAMTNKFAAWSKANRAKFYPVQPELRGGPRPQGLRVARGRARRHRPRHHPHRSGGRHLRRGARPQGEVRGDLRGRFSRDRQGRARSSNARLERLVESGDTRLLGPNTNLNAFENFRDRPRRAVDRARHPVGPPGPPGVPGPGARHPAHPLGADRQRGRPRVRRLRRVLRRPARGRRRRLLHRGLQGRSHADARGRPRREAAQADRDGEGRPDRRPAARWRRATPATSPAPTPSPTRCSASSA